MRRLPRRLREFCQKQKIMRLAFTDGRGYPHVLPLWFVMIGNDYFFGTDRESAKGRAVLKNPRVGWVIDGGTSVRTYKGVSFWGRAEEVTDPRLWRKVWRALGAKYYGSPESRAFQDLYTPETLIVRLKPEGIFFWDYSAE